MSHCVKSYGHLCQIYHDHSPNMITCLQIPKIFNFRLILYQILGKLPNLGKFAKEQKVTGKKQIGGLETPPPSAYRVKHTQISYQVRTKYDVTFMNDFVKIESLKVDFMSSQKQLALRVKKYCVWLKFSGGGRGGDTSKAPSPPTNNFCLYPPPVFRCFWKDPLMTPHHATSSILHCYPLAIHHPFPPPPPKNFDRTHSQARRTISSHCVDMTIC